MSSTARPGLPSARDATFCVRISARFLPTTGPTLQHLRLTLRWMPVGGRASQPRSVLDVVAD